MQVVLFVDGEKELNHFKILVNKDALDFNLYITDSFFEFTSIFESQKIDVIICQINLKACDPCEIFQLSRMYNPDIVPIAIGYKDCINEFIKIFNTENIFRFIRMPVESQYDLINPIKEAYNFGNERKNTSADVEKLALVNNNLMGEINRLNSISAKNHEMFSQIHNLYNTLFMQYFKLANINDQQFIDMLNNIYSNYVYYFYNDIHNFHDSLNQIIARTDEYKDKNISIKLQDIEWEENLDLILFIVSLITDYINLYTRSFNANILIGRNKDRLLIKYSIMLDKEHIEELKEHLKNETFMSFIKFLKSITLKIDLHLTEDSFEYMIIVR